MVATRIPKAIIKDNASYVVIAITSQQGGTDYQESLTYVFHKYFCFPVFISQCCEIRVKLLLKHTKKALRMQSLFHLIYEVIFSQGLLRA